MTIAKSIAQSIVQSLAQPLTGVVSSGSLVPTLHWRADSYSGSAGSYVLTDLTGNGYDATQQSGTATPGTELGFEKFSLSGARFDSSQTLSSHHPGTMVAVIKRNTDAAVGVFGHGGTGSGSGYGFRTVWDGFEGGSAERYLYSGNGSDGGSAAVQADDNSDVGNITALGYFFGRRLRVQTMNGLIIDSASTSMRPPTDTITHSSATMKPSLGTDYRGATFEFYELLYFDRVLAPWELDPWYEAINDRYGLSIPLWSSYTTRACSLLMGQSNALASKSYISGLDSEYTGAQTGVRIWTGTSVTNGDFATLDSSIGSGVGNNTSLAAGQAAGGVCGLEAFVGKEYRDRTGADMDIWKYAVGGTWLANIPGGSNPNGSWGPEYSNAVGPRFANAGEQWWRAIKQWQADSIQPDIKGIIWFQGEQEATDSGNAATYETDLTTFIEEFSDHMIGVQSPPWFVCRLPDDNPATYLSTIRTAQANVAAALSNVNLIDTDAAAMDADSVHLTVAGLDDVGNTIAGLM